MGRFNKGLVAVVILATSVSSYAIVVRDRGAGPVVPRVEAPVVRGPGPLGAPAPGRYFYNGQYYRYYVNGHYYNYYNDGQYYLYNNNGVYSNDNNSIDDDEDDGF